MNGNELDITAIYSNKLTVLKLLFVVGGARNTEKISSHYIQRRNQFSQFYSTLAYRVKTSNSKFDI